MQGFGLKSLKTFAPVFALTRHFLWLYFYLKKIDKFLNKYKTMLPKPVHSTREIQLDKIKFSSGVYHTDITDIVSQTEP